MALNDSNATTIELRGVTLSLDTVRVANIQLGSVTTAGVGLTALGTTAPSGLLSLSIGGWMPLRLSNGSLAYLPVWF